MSDKQPTERTIETSIELDAPVDAVWKALTDAEELANWFPPYAEVKPGEGGHIRSVWSEKQDWTAPISVWEPDRRLELVWCEATPPEKAEQARAAGFYSPFRIAVDYHLETRGGRTVLRVVHRGFSSESDWDHQYDGTVRGWAYQLRGLKHYLEHHRGAKRVIVRTQHALHDLPVLEAWKRILGAGGLAAEGDLARLHAGDHYAVHTAGGDRMEGEVVLVDAPHQWCATVETLNDAFFLLAVDPACKTQPRSEARLWLSSYGLPSDQMDALGQRWQAMLDELFSGARLGA